MFETQDNCCSEHTHPRKHGPGTPDDEIMHYFIALLFVHKKTTDLSLGRCPVIDFIRKIERICEN